MPRAHSNRIIYEERRKRNLHRPSELAHDSDDALTVHVALDGGDLRMTSPGSRHPVAEGSPLAERAVLILDRQAWGVQPPLPRIQLACP